MYISRHDFITYTNIDICITRVVLNNNLYDITPIKGVFYLRAIQDKINMANMTMATQAFVDMNQRKKLNMGNLRLKRFLKWLRYRDNRFALPYEFDLNGLIDGGGGRGEGDQFFLLW